MAATTEVKKTRSQELAADVNALLRARNPVLWVVTREEARVELYLFKAIVAAGYVPRTWDVAAGVSMSIGGKPNPTLADPDTALGKIAEEARQEDPEKKQRGVWIMRDLPIWLAGPVNARTLRNLRNLALALPGTPRETAQAVIILSPSGDVPPELIDHVTVIDWPLPDRAEIAGMLDQAVRSAVQNAKDNPKIKFTVPSETVRAAAIDAAVGLSGEEANACFARSLTINRIDPKMISQEKKRVVARSGLIEWYEPIAGGLDAIGGLDRLKDWLVERQLAFSEKARAYGLPAPKGALLVGQSGCGKSLTAKATSTAWSVPLLRLDLGALKNKYVGDSERNLRRVFDVIQAIGRCVVWLDEIEKGLAGATSGAADGGVSADALGAILTWMEERRGEAFVVATANDVRSLPPEFLRKGRFDEVWFVDLPNAMERVEILTATLRLHERGHVKIDHKKVAAACENFTGSEIASVVPSAMFRAFADKAREITTADLLEAARGVVPLSRTAKDKLNDMRVWGKENAQLATSPITRVTRVGGGRQVDTIDDEETELEI